MFSYVGNVWMVNYSKKGLGSVYWIQDISSRIKEEEGIHYSI